MYYFFIALFFGLGVWAVGSYLVIRSLEEPAYTVLEKKVGYEIREYAPYIVAETKATGTFSEATNQGFRNIADYIFGNNMTKESIAMTVPVLENQNVLGSEKIAMTTPVLETADTNATRTIAFVLPSKYTLETLPIPNNPLVTLREIPAQKVAVLTFTWYPTSARTEKKKAELTNYLLRDNQTITGQIQTARYNPPLSMPLTLRNEIIIPIQ